MRVVLAVPVWVWATLLMTAFVAVSVATMWFTRYALKEPPRFGDQAQDVDAGEEGSPREG